MSDLSESICHRVAAWLWVGVAVLFGGLVMAGPASAMGSQKQRPVIALSCPEKTTEMTEALCDALYRQLQQSAPHSVLRRGQDLASVPGSLVVELSVGAQSRTMLPARLRWKTATTGGWETGPEMTLSVSDTAVSDTMMPRLAQDLLQISDLPLLGAKSGADPKG